MTTKTILLTLIATFLMLWSCDAKSAGTAKNTNADLSTLSISTGTLAPAFSAGMTKYSLTVPAKVTSLTITATTAAPNAKVSITPLQPIALAEGINQVTVTVTAESGVQKVYSVAVTRQATLDYKSTNIGTLIHVPAGTFQRDATATNLSTVSAFRMSKHEITRAQWTAVTGWAGLGENSRSSGTSDPVQNLSWYAAIAFCNKLSLLEGLTPVYAVSGVDFSTLTYAQIPTGEDWYWDESESQTPSKIAATWNAVTANWSADGYRLPTEMEWMWAAMGADTANPGAVNTSGYARAFAGSTGSNAIGDYAWYTANSTDKTHPAGTKLPNELGLYDLSGNVFEWVWDLNGDYPAGTVKDYRGATSGFTRLYHGEDFCSDIKNVTVSHRYSDFPYLRNDSSGFRVVRN